MLTHELIWQAIDRLAAAKGYSPSGLAKQAGLDPTTFNKSKRVSTDGKPRWPSTESIAKILAVTGATMSEFLELGTGDGATLAPGLRVAVRSKDGSVATGTVTAVSERSVSLQPDGGGKVSDLKRSDIDWVAVIVSGY